ncbi:hypothetical protein [Rhodoblastus sp.]|uniref:hypothetical protein n=1 Tax=Rhodoblastus sp. TaxID=1962975 RepID=UPI0035AED16D
MRISFDSNAWEQVFRSDTQEYATIRSALVARKVEGVICEAAFRIEAVRKKERVAYFAQPHMEVSFPWRIVERDGEQYVHLMSIGPADHAHPGLPEVQAERLKLAMSAGIRLMRGLAWMGLPSPSEISNSEAFLQETESERNEREQRQIDVSAEIWGRKVGKQAFDAMGGWQAIRRGQLHEKRFAKACAEWADGELAAAHVAYRNDILCTEDRAVAAGVSIFDRSHRSWLATEYGVRFASLKDVAAIVGA